MHDPEVHRTLRDECSGTAGAISLTVVCATDREGLSAENAFALRDIIVAAGPLDVQVLPPGSFVAFFAGDEAGKADGERLAAAIRSRFAGDAATEFSVVVDHGPCHVIRNAAGGFTSYPTGDVVIRAMRTAMRGADHA